MNIESFIRDIPDFPKKGIRFKDISPLLQSAEAFTYSIDLMAEKLNGKYLSKIVGIDSRGFIFGAALAQKMRLAFVPIRKAGKLPSKCFKESYDLEYGQDTLELHQDALHYRDRVVLVDDLLATGGTAHAAKKLIQRTGANLELMLFLIELDFLNGRNSFGSTEIKSLIHYS